MTIEGVGEVEELRRKLWRSGGLWSYECAFRLGLEEGRLAGNYTTVLQTAGARIIECNGEIQRCMYVFPPPHCRSLARQGKIGQPQHQAANCYITGNMAIIQRILIRITIKSQPDRLWLSTQLD